MNALRTVAVCAIILGSSSAYSQNVATGTASGDSSAYTLRVNIAPQASHAGGGAQAYYYIYAQVPSGQRYSFTKAGWVPVVNGSLSYYELSDAPYAGKSFSVTDNMDLRGLEGTVVAAGYIPLLLGKPGPTFYSNVVASVWAKRPLSPSSFPAQIGAWTVERYVDAITDKVTCYLTVSAIGDSLYMLFAGFVGGKNYVSTYGGMYGYYTGSYITGVNSSATQVRVDSNAAMALYAATPSVQNVLGYDQGAFLQQLLTGSSLVVSFVPTNISRTYTFTRSTAGFAQAFGAFAYCVDSAPK